MTRPTRWRDEGPDDVRDLLRYAAKTRDLAPADRARTRARVARIGGIVAAAAGLSLVQSAALGAGLAVATLVAVSIGTTWLSPSPQPVVVLASRPVAPSPSALSAPSVPAATPSSTAAAASSAPRADPPTPRPSALHAAAPPLVEEPAASAPTRPPDTLAEEAALIERARLALGASPADALARTEEHAARFPAGKLSMERELVAIDALGRLGRRAEARSRADSLLARARGGLYEERLRQLLDALH
jgi:hypothetical protein